MAFLKTYIFRRYYEIIKLGLGATFKKLRHCMGLEPIWKGNTFWALL